MVSGEGNGVRGDPVFDDVVFRVFLVRQA